MTEFLLAASTTPITPAATPTSSPAEEARPKAPAVVLLHGMFMDSSLWDGVLSELPEVRATRLDLPSHGRSPDLPAGSDLADHVTAVADTLDHLQLDRAVLVGHSWGGMIALRLATRRPDLVAGLVLANTPLLRVHGGARVGFHAQRLLLAIGMPAAAYGRGAAGALLGPDHRQAHPEDVASLVARTKQLGRHRLRETVRSVVLEPDDALAMVDALTVPWVAVAGADDYVLHGGVRETLAAAGDLRVTAGGHATPLEDPVAVAGAVRDVLARLAAHTR